MGLDGLRSKFRGRYSMLEEKSVKVSTCNSRFLRGGGYVATTLPEEAQDRLTLELADQPLLARDKPVFGRNREASGLLQMKRKMLGLDRPIAGQDDRPLDDVLELTEVAWPRIPLE